MRPPARNCDRFALELAVVLIGAERFFRRTRVRCHAVTLARKPGVVELVHEQERAGSRRLLVRLGQDLRTGGGGSVYVSPYGAQPRLAPCAEERTAIEPQASLLGQIFSNAVPLVEYGQQVA